jgi:hypothetical protein
MGKIKQSFNVKDWEVSTNIGWTDIKQVHLIEDDFYYLIETKSYKLKCANTHLVFDDKFNPIRVEDLHHGDIIVTAVGPEPVTSITQTYNKEPMYDLTVEGERYLSNGILSHNTTVVAIFGLHYGMFNKDKTIAIMANKMQGAIEIISRIQILLEGLPAFLRPGIKEYNKKSIVFENGCKILAAATSASAVRGLSINCMTGENEVTVQDMDTGEIINISLSDLYTNLIIDQNKEKQNENI